MVAKAKARAKVFEESESGHMKLFPQKEEGRPSKQSDIDHYLQRGSHQKQIQNEDLPSRKTDIVLWGIMHLSKTVIIPRCWSGCVWWKPPWVPPLHGTIPQTGRVENWGPIREINPLDQVH